jgi:hypothetical protein
MCCLSLNAGPSWMPPPHASKRAGRALLSARAHASGSTLPCASMHAGPLGVLRLSPIIGVGLQHRPESTAAVVCPAVRSVSHDAVTSLPSSKPLRTLWAALSLLSE